MELLIREEPLYKKWKLSDSLVSSQPHISALVEQDITVKTDFAHPFGIFLFHAVIQGENIDRRAGKTVWETIEPVDKAGFFQISDLSKGQVVFRIGKLLSLIHISFQRDCLQPGDGLQHGGEREKCEGLHYRRAESRAESRERQRPDEPLLCVIMGIWDRCFLYRNICPFLRDRKEGLFHFKICAELQSETVVKTAFYCYNR